MINELILVGVSFFHPHPPIDSLGVETVNGRVFVIHKVDEKETLYAIARRYGASVDAIKTSNPGMSATLEVGQIVKVPYAKRAPDNKSASASSKHVVQPKETMYSISRAYGVSVDDLKKWNNLSDNSLSVGQELVVRKPSAGSQSTNATVRQETDVKAAPVPASGTHTVETKETLYSIARHYGLTVAQIRSWNSLTSDELQVGQSIFVAAPSQRKAATVTQNTGGSADTGTKVIIAEQTPAKSEPAQKENSSAVKNENAAVKNETPAQRTEPVASSNPKNQTIRISESLKNSDEITESGVAELIDGTEGNRKYLALHRTAPVGTILKVRNEMNNREVFVRVMGKLPETSVNDKLIIKISRSAYDRLGAIDPRFRVELTYYK